MSVSVKFSPIGNGQQFFDIKGQTLSNGSIYTYVGGSTTPQSTYTDGTGGTANPNPMTLGSNGILSNAVWLQSGSPYKFVLKDQYGVTLAVYDNVSGINDVQSSVTIPTGSVTIFQQTTVPTGWTRVMTYDDAALRLVGSSTPSSGGTNGFSFRLGSFPTSSDGHALTTAEIPSHGHTFSINTGSGGVTSQLTLFQSNSSTAGTIPVDNAGSGTPHTHAIIPNVKYVDVMLCSKN